MDRTPAVLFCADDMCTVAITSGRVLQNVHTSGGDVIKEDTKAEVVGKSADPGSTFAKVRIDGRYFYIDASFLSEVDSVNSKNLKRVENKENIKFLQKVHEANPNSVGSTKENQASVPPPRSENTVEETHGIAPKTPVNLNIHNAHTSSDHPQQTGSQNVPHGVPLMDNQSPNSMVADTPTLSKATVERLVDRPNHSIGQPPAVPKSNQIDEEKQVNSVPSQSSNSDLLENKLKAPSSNDLPAHHGDLNVNDDGYSENDDGYANMPKQQVSTNHKDNNGIQHEEVSMTEQMSSNTMQVEHKLDAVVSTEPGTVESLSPPQIIKTISKADKPGMKNNEEPGNLDLSPTAQHDNNHNSPPNLRNTATATEVDGDQLTDRVSQSIKQVNPEADPGHTGKGDTASTETDKSQLPDGHSHPVDQAGKRVSERSGGDVSHTDKENTTDPTASTEADKSQLPDGHSHPVDQAGKRVSERSDGDVSHTDKENTTDPTASTEADKSQLPDGHSHPIDQAGVSEGSDGVISHADKGDTLKSAPKTSGTPEVRENVANGSRLGNMGENRTDAHDDDNVPMDEKGSGSNTPMKEMLTVTESISDGIRAPDNQSPDRQRDDSVVNPPQVKSASKNDDPSTKNNAEEMKPGLPPQHNKHRSSQSEALPTEANNDETPGRINHIIDHVGKDSSDNSQVAASQTDKDDFANSHSGSVPDGHFTTAVHKQETEEPEPENKRQTDGEISKQLPPNVDDNHQFDEQHIPKEVGGTSVEISVDPPIHEKASTAEQELNQTSANLNETFVLDGITIPTIPTTLTPKDQTSPVDVDQNIPQSEGVSESLSNQIGKHFNATDAGQMSNSLYMSHVHLGLMQCIALAATTSSSKHHGLAGVNRSTSPLSQLFVNMVNYFMSSADAVLNYIPPSIRVHFDRLFVASLSLPPSFLVAWSLFVTQMFLLVVIIRFSLIVLNQSFLWLLRRSRKEQHSDPTEKLFVLTERVDQLSHQLIDQETTNGQLASWAADLLLKLQSMDGEIQSRDGLLSATREELTVTTDRLRSIEESHLTLLKNHRALQEESDEQKNEFNEEKNHWQEHKVELEELYKSQIAKLQEEHKNAIQEAKQEHEELYRQSLEYYDRMKAMHPEMERAIECRKEAEEKLVTVQAKFDSLSATFATLKSFEMALEKEVEVDGPNSDYALVGTSTDSVMDVPSDPEHEDKEGEEIDACGQVVSLNQHPDSKVRASLALFLDIGRLRAELDSTTNQLKVAEAKSADEHLLRIELESRLEQVGRECIELKGEVDRLNDERESAQTKLDVLSGYFKEREVELQRDLGKQVVVGSESSEALNSMRKRTKELEAEIKASREHIASLRRELSETERVGRRQLSELDKRSHEHWLAARASDHTVKELRDENASLRQKLIEAELALLPPALRHQQKPMNERPRSGGPTTFVLNSMARAGARGSLSTLTDGSPNSNPNLPFPLPMPPPPMGLRLPHGSIPPPPPPPPFLPPPPGGKVPFPHGFLPPPPGILPPNMPLLLNHRSPGSTTGSTSSRYSNLPSRTTS